MMRRMSIKGSSKHQTKCHVESRAGVLAFLNHRTCVVDNEYTDTLYLGSLLKIKYGTDGKIVTLYAYAKAEGDISKTKHGMSKIMKYWIKFSKPDIAKKFVKYLLKGKS